MRRDPSCKSQRTRMPDDPAFPRNGRVLRRWPARIPACLNGGSSSSLVVVVGRQVEQALGVRLGGPAGSGARPCGSPSLKFSRPAMDAPAGAARGRRQRLLSRHQLHPLGVAHHLVARQLLDRLRHRRRRGGSAGRGRAQQGTGAMLAMFQWLRSRIDWIVGLRVVPTSLAISPSVSSGWNFHQPGDRRSGRCWRLESGV